MVQIRHLPKRDRSVRRQSQVRNRLGATFFTALEGTKKRTAALRSQLTFTKTRVARQTERMLASLTRFLGFRAPYADTDSRTASARVPRARWSLMLRRATSGVDLGLLHPAPQDFLGQPQ